MRYDLLAQQHRPNDPAALSQEVRRLSAAGLKPRDIASHLALHIDIVLRMLLEQTPAGGHSDAAGVSQ